jgi:hypothetical protein
MAKVGRPTKYNKKKADEILGYMQAGYTLVAAAAKADIARSTVYKWEEDIPEFSDIIKKGKDSRQAFLENRILGADQSPVVTSSIFLLKTHNREDFGEKATHEVTGAGGEPLIPEPDDIDLAKAVVAILSRANKE